jgi:hypothetical protein
MGGGAEVKWEYELMRDMLERAREYEGVQTFECMKTAAMLKQAATVMSHWDRKIVKLEAALERIRDCDWVITLPDRMDAVRQIAREALE